MTTSPLRLIIAVAAALAIAGPAAGAATLTVAESATDVRVGSGVITSAPASTVFFGGMYSPQGNPRGFAMGYEDLPTGTPGVAVGSTLVLAFGSGPRIVARAPGRAARGAVKRLLGGTGPYLGMRGTERTVREGAKYVHTITYTLPPKGTARVREDYIVRYEAPTIIARGAPGGVGDARNIGGPLTTPSGQPAGYYHTDSVLMHTYSGGLYQWFVANGTYTFPDGSTLRAVGPFQRATATAPGVLRPSPRVVFGGTGRYAGMRGQVVVTSNPDGSATNSFTLVK
jgi:hypothetical protein